MIKAQGWGLRICVKILLLVDVKKINLRKSYAFSIHLVSLASFLFLSPESY